MNPTPMQKWIDEVLESSVQQWLLRFVAVAMAFGALAAAAGANERWWPAGFFVVGLFAAASAIRPDTPTALLTVIAVVWHWLATVDGPGGPWLLLATLCLLCYHGVIALAASLPTGGELAAATIAGWLRRLGLPVAVTTLVWGFVELLDGRDAAGNGLLTGLALAIVAAAAVLIRARSIKQPS